MNKRLWFKVVFLLLVLLLMVLMGMSNTKYNVTFRLLHWEVLTAKAALMYFLFFSVGVVAGAVVAVGPRQAFKSKKPQE